MAGYGTRQGWNQRGTHTPRELQEFIKEQQAAEWARAEKVLLSLLDVVGSDVYIAWVDANITDRDTPAEIRQKAFERLGAELRAMTERQDDYRRDLEAIQ